MTKLFLLAILAFTLAAASPATATDNSTSSPPPSPPPPPQPTAYELLGKYGFPPGVLPEGVQGYELGGGADNSSAFQVNLPADCDFRAAKKYVLHYSSRIAGDISAGSISSLEGVKVKMAFAWLHISQVDVDGDDLKLHVGPFTKSFPLADFAVSPHCN